MNDVTGTESTALWEGRTPFGLPIVVERDDRRRWIATVAGTMQSRNRSAVTALAEATGLPSRHPWVTWVAQMCAQQEGAAR